MKYSHRKTSSQQTVFFDGSTKDHGRTAGVFGEEGKYGCAVPADKTAYGYISEHHAFGQTARQAGDYAEDLAAAMLASTLGIDFNADESWDEKKEIFRISGKIVSTRNITQSSIVKYHGYTTVMAAVVFAF